MSIGFFIELFLLIQRDSAVTLLHYTLNSIYKRIVKKIHYFKNEFKSDFKRLANLSCLHDTQTSGSSAFFL